MMVGPERRSGFIWQISAARFQAPLRSCTFIDPAQLIGGWEASTERAVQIGVDESTFEQGWRVRSSEELLASDPGSRINYTQRQMVVGLNTVASLQSLKFCSSLDPLFKGSRGDFIQARPCPHR